MTVLPPRSGGGWIIRGLGTHRGLGHLLALPAVDSLCLLTACPSSLLFPLACPSVRLISCLLGPCGGGISLPPSSPAPNGARCGPGLAPLRASFCAFLCPNSSASPPFGDPLPLFSAVLVSYAGAVAELRPGDMRSAQCCRLKKIIIVIIMIIIIIIIISKQRTFFVLLVRIIR